VEWRSCEQGKGSDFILRFFVLPCPYLGGGEKLVPFSGLQWPWEEGIWGTWYTYANFQVPKSKVPFS
jgi:hypothetical protein